MMLPFIAFLMLWAGAVPLPDAVVTQDREVFTLTSATSGELSVSRTVVVNGKEGMDAATLVLYCDSFRTLQSFSGTVQGGSSKPIKLKKGDLVSFSDSSGLVDDDVTYSYLPTGHFPLTVHYEYKIAYRNGISSFPGFFPVEDEKVAVAEAVYTISVPAGYGVKQHSSPMLRYRNYSEKGRDFYCWELKDFQPVVQEVMMPPARELVPYVYASPETINLGGYVGTQHSWQDLGAWLYGMQDGCQNLTDQEKERVRSLTAGCNTALEKLQVLYAYLRERTRYVSIQLGIGGYRPFPAAEVSRTGFGDCKGLSNYMKALLAAAGVESEYFIINTEEADLLPDYASAGQMNHAMLAVPLPELKDTVWVECTNPSVPLGYRHSDAAGHQVVLIKADGGQLVRIPAYPDSLSLRRQHFDVRLSGDGQARISVRRTLQVDRVDDYIGFRSLPPLKQVQRLTSGLKISPDHVKVEGITDNFADYPHDGKGFVPRMDIDYSFDTGAYGTLSGNRLFVPMNPTSKSLPVQKSTRVNDLFLREGGRVEESFTIHIPEGFKPEGVPEDVLIHSRFGVLQSSARISPDGKTMEILQSLTLFPFRVPASEYATYRDFARAVNQAYSATIVLVAAVSGE